MNSIKHIYSSFNVISVSRCIVVQSLPIPTLPCPHTLSELDTGGWQGELQVDKMAGYSPSK